MGKLLLLSIVFATVLVPALCARERHPVRALKRMLVFALGFLVFYALAIVYLYPRL